MYYPLSFLYNNILSDTVSTQPVLSVIYSEAKKRLSTSVSTRKFEIQNWYEGNTLSDIFSIRKLIIQRSFYMI